MVVSTIQRDRNTLTINELRESSPIKDNIYTEILRIKRSFGRKWFKIPDDVLIKFGHELRELRDFHGMTLSHVACLLDRTPKDICIIERVTYKIKKMSTFIFYLEAFSLIYNVSPFRFLPKKYMTECKSIA